jgi:hypothetical protein
MLDYLTAGIAFWMALFGVQELLLEFRLGYLGRYWFLAISTSLLLSFLLSAPITITLIIRFAVDPFTWTGNVILCAIAAVIFGVILSLAQWLILRQTREQPRGIITRFICLQPDSQFLNYRDGTGSQFPFRVTFAKDDFGSDFSFGIVYVALKQRHCFIHPTRCIKHHRKQRFVS